jgi:hypothetical protein
VRTVLAEQTTVLLDELFAAATSRLEAIATFLALLEMLKRAEIQVEPGPAGVLTVSLVPSSQVAARSDDGTSSCSAGVETPPASAEVAST